MKSLSAFKGIATRLRKQIAKTKEMVSECENSYYDNPCTLTIEALDKAEKKLYGLEIRLGYAIEMIEHYDFYQRCWDEEEREAMGREAYNRNPIILY